MQTTTSSRHLPPEPFPGARRILFEQAETFSAPPEYVMPSLDGIVKEITSGKPYRTTDASDYYDAADLRLASAGVALRHDGADQEWAVVLPEVSAGGEPIRREVRYPGRADTVPDGVRHVLHTRLQRKPLVKVAHMATRSVTTPLVNHDGIRIADIVDEHAVATRADGRHQQLRRIDVRVHDLDGVGHQVLRQVHRMLTASGCRIESPRTQLLTALGGSHTGG